MISIRTLAAAAFGLAVLASTGTARADRKPPLPSHQAPSVVGKLTTGDTIVVTNRGRLKSGAIKKGDTIDFVVAEDVKDPDGNVLIARDTAAVGTVVRSKASGAFGKAGELRISVDSTTATDGHRVSLRADKAQKGEGKGLASIGGGALLAWPLLFLKGGNTTIPPGTRLIVYVNEPIVVDLAAARRAEAKLRP